MADLGRISRILKVQYLEDWEKLVKIDQREWNNQTSFNETVKGSFLSISSKS